MALCEVGKQFMNETLTVVLVDDEELVAVLDDGEEVQPAEPHGDVVEVEQQPREERHGHQEQRRWWA